MQFGVIQPCSDFEEKGRMRAEWSTSTNNCKTRFYTLTKAGRLESGAFSMPEGPPGSLLVRA